MPGEHEIPSSMSLDEAAAALNSRIDEGRPAADEHSDADAAAEAENDDPQEPAGDEEQEQSDSEAEDSDNTEPDEATDDDGPSIKTLSDLAEALEQPLETVLSSLTTEITVDGETKQVTIREALDGFNLAQASQQRMKQVAEDRRQLETQKTQHLTELERHHQILGGVLNKMRSMIMGHIDPAKLEALKAEDPGRYAQVRLEIEDRQRMFDQMVQEGGAAYEQMSAGRTQEDRQRLAEYVQGERTKLAEAVPEWSDAEGKKVADYLASYQYEPEQLDAIVDHRTLVIARKAMLYDQMQEKAKTVTTKVKQLPKLLKPGPKQAAIRADSNAIQAARKRFKTSHSLEDAAALLNAQSRTSR